MKRGRKWMMIAGGVLALGLLVLAWPTSVQKEPRPDLLAGLKPTRIGKLFAYDDSEVQTESYVLSVTFAAAVRELAAEAPKLGLTRLRTATLWTADYGGTDGYTVRVDTFPGRRLGKPALTTLPAMIIISKRSLKTPSAHVWDVYYRAEKRVKTTLGLWP